MMLLQDSHYCGMIDTGNLGLFGGWNDVPCDGQTGSYICQIYKGQLACRADLEASLLTFFLKVGRS